MKLATVILAAGEGTRMKSNLTKLLHPLAGKPVAQYVVDIAQAVGAEETVFVIGKDNIRALIDQMPSDGEADAAGGSGNDGSFSGN